MRRTCALGGYQQVSACHQYASHRLHLMLHSVIPHESEVSQKPISFVANHRWQNIKNCVLRYVTYLHRCGELPRFPARCPEAGYPKAIEQSAQRRFRQVNRATERCSRRHDETPRLSSVDPHASARKPQDGKIEPRRCAQEGKMTGTGQDQPPRVADRCGDLSGVLARDPASCSPSTTRIDVSTSGVAPCSKSAARPASR